MRNVFKILITILPFIFLVQIKAQDVHFSSLGFNPMFFNPAMTGFMNDKFRVSTIFRNQWQSVAPGYNTFFAGLEFQPWMSFNESKAVGLGVSFTNDVAGSLSFGQRDLAVAGSYIFALDKKNTAYLSFGIEAIRQNWGYDIKDIRLNRQNEYDDNITYSDINTTDVSFGTAFRYSPKQQTLLNMGVAVFHINQPKMSYFSSSEDFLHRRIYANVSYLFPLKNYDRFSLNPQIIYQHQHRFTEVLIGTELLFDFAYGIFNTQIVSLGVFYRNKDAMIVCPKIRYNNFTAGMSYDVNISRLSKVSNTYGAVELWLSYSFTPYYSANKKLTKIPCPIF